MGSQNNETDVAFIASLAELLKANDLSEIEVKRVFGDDDSINVRVSRQSAAPAPVIQHVAAAPAAAAVAPAPAPAAAAPAAPPAAPASADPADDPNAVASPMVGTVYLQAEPGAPSFVSAGHQVSEGDTLLIIEAMKTMNHIPATRAGTVKRILVEDGATVEYGSPLMIIE